MIACAGAVGAQPYTEVQVSRTNFADIEFDSARDGLYCRSCNFDQGNARFNWSDHAGHLWVGHVDWYTGAFVPADGHSELVDTNAAFWSDFGNGAEWAFSAAGSQLVYTRYEPGITHEPAHAGAALASMSGGAWVVGFLPGAIAGSGVDGPTNSALPEASQASADTQALVIYNNYANPLQMYWETASLTGTEPVEVPFGTYANGVSERWIPQTRQLVFIGSATDPGTQTTHQQVYWYDIDTNAVVQLTADPTDKNDAFLFRAPEFGGSYALVTVSGGTEVDVYEQSGTGGDGPPPLGLVNRIQSTDAAEPYISSVEPFINCTPQCHTYVFMTLRASLTSTTNGLAVASIDPQNPMFTVLASALSPAVERADPEYFITARGPYLYYERIVPGSSRSLPKVQGEYYIDLQLGAPSGPCVGSSAEGGMIPGC